MLQGPSDLAILNDIRAGRQQLFFQGRRPIDVRSIRSLTAYDEHGMVAGFVKSGSWPIGDVQNAVEWLH